MALEIEVKLCVPDLTAVRDRLQRAGARYVAHQLETNTFLDTADNALLKSGAGLRIRRAIDLRTGVNTVIITHKGKQLASAMKVRPETELTVSNYQDALALLQQLGYQQRLSFEKRRETWELSGCEVVLDELPQDLGSYVEIEGSDEACITALRHTLELDRAPIEPRSYASLVRAHLGDTGGDVLTFG